MRLSTFSPSALVVLSLLVFPQTACHKKQVPVALPPQPQAHAEQPGNETKTPVPNELPSPPVLAPSNKPAPVPPVPDETLYQKNKPSEQPAPPKRPSRPANPVPPAVQGPTQPSPTADAPRLGDVLTPDQQKQYSAAIDQSLNHAQASLGNLGNRQLSQEQQATVAQVKSFIEQAQEKRKTDLAAAKSLAERADVLANDLLASLR